MSTLLKGSDYSKSTPYETPRYSGLHPREMGIRSTYGFLWVTAYAGRGLRFYLRERAILLHSAHEYVARECLQSGK